MPELDTITDEDPVEVYDPDDKDDPEYKDQITEDVERWLRDGN